MHLNDKEMMSEKKYIMHKNYEFTIDQDSFDIDKDAKLGFTFLEMLDWRQMYQRPLTTKSVICWF